MMELSDLPPVFREVAEAIGLPAALALVERWGGVPVWVPATVSADHPLAAEIGLEAARTLSGIYQGDYLLVPRCARAVRKARDVEIRRRHRDGETARQLALAYGLTERQVWNILAGDASGIDRKQIGLL